MKQRNAQGALQIDAERLKIEQFNAQTERMKIMEDEQTKQAQAMADAEKERTEQLRIQAEAMQSQAEHERTVAETVKTTAETPSLEDMAQLIIQSRQTINGMTIKAPSGGVYDVTLQ